MKKWQRVLLSVLLAGALHRSLSSMTIDREIGLFSCTIEHNEVEATPFIVVSRESRLMNYCLFVLQEGELQTTPYESQENPDTPQEE